MSASVICYLAGPLETGVFPPEANVRAACHVAEDLRRVGASVGLRVVVIVPHLSLHADLVTPRPREEWLADCLLTVEACDVLYRFGGRSEGADAEVAHARTCGVPVVAGLSDWRVRCEMWARAQRGCAMAH